LEKLREHKAKSKALWQGRRAVSVRPFTAVVAGGPEARVGSS